MHNLLPDLNFYSQVELTIHMADLLLKSNFT